MKYIFTIGLCFVCSALAFTQMKNDFKPKSVCGFIENKGQLVDQNGEFNDEVKFLLNSKNINVQLRSYGFSYDVYQLSENPIQDKSLPSRASQKEGNKSKSIHFNRVDVEFLGANPNVQFKTEHVLAGVSHFLMNGRTVMNVETYQKVSYIGIYPNIDVEFISNPGGDKPIEYNFVLHPGAQMSDIKLNYKGAILEEIATTSLRFKTNHGILLEQIPASYYQTNKQPIEVHYALIKQGDSQNCTIGFTSQKLDPKQTMVIDPTPNIVWSNYFGGTADDEILDIKTDPSNMLYFCGVTSSVGNIASSGAYETTNQGYSDAFLAKFDNNGARQWATYFGGIWSETAKALSIDANGNIVVCGSTSSEANIASPGAFQTLFGGWEDAFVSKFTSSGQLSWSSYFGGPDYDAASDLCVDASGAIFVTGVARSPGLSYGAGIHQSAPYAGSSDVFILKLSASGSRIWSTYYGGSTYEFEGFIQEKNGNIYLSGTTESPDGITSIPNNYFNYDGVNTSFSDAFVAKFNSDGGLIWGRYYGGSYIDLLLDMAIDQTENILLVGKTYSWDGIATAGSSQPDLDGPSDGFLCRLNSSGTIVNANYIGGSDYDEANAVAINSNNDVYVFGSTYSQNSIATATMYQTTISSLSDAYFVKYNAAGTKIYGSYFGKTGDDFAREIVFDSQDYIYLIGQTTSSNFGVSASYQNVINGGTESFFARFEPDCVPPLAPTNTTSATNLAICPNTSTTLTVSGNGNLKWYSVAVGGTLLATGNSYTTPSLSSPTSYYVEGFTCGVSPRTAISVTIDALPNVTAAVTPASICPGQSCTFSGGGANTYVWNNGVTNGGIFYPTETGTFQVTGTNSSTGCSNTATATITLKTVPDIIAGSTSLFNCYNTPVTLFGSGGVSYTWNNAVSNNVSFNILSTTTYTVTGVGANGCTNTDQITVEAYLPDATFLRSGNSFVPITSGGSYKWLECPSYTIVAATFSFAPPNNFTEYALVISKNGCTDTSACKSLTNVGLTEVNGSQALLSIFPNPAQNYVQITSKQEDISVLKLIDATGKLVFESHAAQSEYIIELTQFSTGMYYLELTLGDQLVREKLLIE